ncbi:MAG: ankyrin repeat domain-containing protein [Planctomycetaceae bacterium]|jgi:ankyrin repeat protein/uncharacterized protein YegL|nr:ankyrin repeat domain-containing protein [Planctomycetaceae bacterium]
MRRLPVYILVDCSALMSGEAIEAVKVGLDKLLSSLRRDPYALEGVYVSLITYSNDADVFVTLTELSDFQLPEITLAESSNRNLGQAIELLCQRYDEEVRKTTSEQKGDWLPFVVMLTGGDPDEEEHLEQILPKFREYLFAKIIVCVAGADKPTRILRSLTKDIFLLDTMNSHSFSRFWQWVSKITSVQSRSFDQLQEELPPPPPEFNPFYSVDNVTVNNVVENVVVETVENPVETPTTPSFDIFGAVQRNDLSTVQQWINIDAKLVRAKDQFGKTPLHCAAWDNYNVDICRYLISQGADVNAKNKSDRSPLHYAAWNNSNVDICKYLISQRADVNAKDKLGWSPLHWAAWDNSLDICKYLISQGADVNAKDDFDRTPLHYAAKNSSNVEVIKYLISQGADVNDREGAGFTPLHHAALSNPNVDILECLISQGADVNAKDKRGETPIDFANTWVKKQILRNASITSNPPPKTFPPNPLPPTLPPNSPPPIFPPSRDIFEAIKQNDLLNVQQRININAQLVHAKDPFGLTTLYIAARNCSNVEIFKYLIAQGADVNAKDRYGQTLLDVANTEEKKQILRNAMDTPNSPPPTLFQRIKKFLFYPIFLLRIHPLYLPPVPIDIRVGYVVLPLVLSMLGIWANSISFLIGFAIISFIGILAFTLIIAVLKEDSRSRALNYLPPIDNPLSLRTTLLLSLSLGSMLLLVFFIFGMIAYFVVYHDFSYAWIWFLCGIQAWLSVLPFAIDSIIHDFQFKPVPPEMVKFINDYLSKLP